MYLNHYRAQLGTVLSEETPFEGSLRENLTFDNEEISDRRIYEVMTAVGLLYAYNGMISVHFYIAVALGISFTMLLGGGLMGLAFLSNGTGHDASVDNKLPSRDELWSKPDDD